MLLVVHIRSLSALKDLYHYTKWESMIGPSCGIYPAQHTLLTFISYIIPGSALSAMFRYLTPGKRVSRYIYRQRFLFWPWLRYRPGFYLYLSATTYFLGHDLLVRHGFIHSTRLIYWQGFVDCPRHLPGIFWASWNLGIMMPTTGLYDIFLFLLMRAFFLYYDTFLHRSTTPSFVTSRHVLR